MGTTNIKSFSVKYRDTAPGILAQQIGVFAKKNNKNLLFTKNFSRSMSSDETKVDKTSEESFVPVQVAYKSFEAQEGPDEKLVPIIFQHNVLSSKENWENIPQILADKTKRKVYALDARNHGDSEWSDASDCDTLAHDLIHFMTTNGIAKCVLIGHSMGGVSGLRAALKQPDMFEMLFVEECGVNPVPRKMQDLVLKYLNLLRNTISEIPPNLNENETWIFIKNTLEKLGPEQPSKVKTPSSQNIPFALKRQPDGRYGLKGNLEAIIRYVTLPCSEPVGTYEGPAFFMYGKQSPFEVHTEEDCIKRHFPKANFIPVEGASHEIHASCPEEFMEIILKYLKNPQSSQILKNNL